MAANKQVDWWSKAGATAKATAKSIAGTWDKFYSEHKPIAIGSLMVGGHMALSALRGNNSSGDNKGSWARSALPWAAALGLGYYFRNELKAGWNLATNYKKLQEAGRVVKDPKASPEARMSALNTLGKVGKDPNQMKVLGFFSPDTKKQLGTAAQINDIVKTPRVFEDIALLSNTDYINNGNSNDYFSAANRLVDLYHSKEFQALPDDTKKMVVGKYGDILTSNDPQKNKDLMQDLIALKRSHNVCLDSSANMYAKAKAGYTAVQAISRLRDTNTPEQYKRLTKMFPALDKIERFIPKQLV